MARSFLSLMTAAAALLLLAPPPAAAATPTDAPVAKIVGLTATSFLRGGPVEAYRFGIYASGVDAGTVVVFDRETVVPIDKTFASGTGDDNVAVPPGQQYLLVTVPRKFRDRVGKVAVQLSEDGLFSLPVYIYINSALAVP